MKKYNISRINQGIMLSFILLSSGVLASDNLNFKYTRADASSSDGSLSKVANSCHNLTDPINIRVLFKPMDTLNRRVKLIINGFGTNYGYTVYLPPSTSRQDVSRPFGANIEGSVKVFSNQTERPSTVSYDDPFCFSEPFIDRGREELSHSYYYRPIYKNPPYDPGLNGDDYERYCSGRITHGGVAGGGTYWPAYDPVGVLGGNIPHSPYSGPSLFIWSSLKQPWGLYMGRYMFYRQMVLGLPTPGDGGSYDYITDDKDTIQGVGCKSNGSCIAGFTGNTEINFPIGVQVPANRPDITVNGSKISSGEFNIKVFNRNIAYMELKIFDEFVIGGEKKEITVAKYTWNRENFASNVLTFSKNIEVGKCLALSAFDIENDPYQSFYDTSMLEEGKGYEFFRGTLMPASILNQKYRDNNNKVMALSLPAESRGDINLVNTDSLTFKIGARNYPSAPICGYGDLYNPEVTIYGQPLKFNPTKSGDVERFNALQVRNACY